MSSKNTMIKRCSFATGASVQQAFFERCQRGVSKTRVFGTAQALISGLVNCGQKSVSNGVPLLEASGRIKNVWTDSSG